MAAKRYGCATCGKQATADQMIFSRHTGNRFCRDFMACRKRHARLARKRVAA